MSERIGYAAGGDRLAVRGHTLRMGVVLFLASELMFFASWFAAYYDLRGRNVRWGPPPGHPLGELEPGIGTALLVLSSIFVIVAIERGLKKRRPAYARRWLVAAVTLAVIFIGLTLHEWATNGFGLSYSAYGSLHYGMTGFHAAHVTVGIILLSFLAAGVNRPAFLGENVAGADAIGYYWHFVTVVWLGIWASIFLVK